MKGTSSKESQEEYKFTNLITPVEIIKSQDETVHKPETRTRSTNGNAMAPLKIISVMCQIR